MQSSGSRLNVNTAPNASPAELYHALAESARTGTPYQTSLNPPPVDPTCCEPPKATFAN